MEEKSANLGKPVANSVENRTNSGQAELRDRGRNRSVSDY